ncbi:MAG: porphobilinogen synthase [Candidatus Thorarchaeota archaeon]
MRRLRITKHVRDLMREIRLSSKDLIYPIFVKEGLTAPEPINTMPGQFRIPLNQIINEVEQLISLRIPAVIIFGIPIKKDSIGTSASDPEGIVQLAVKTIKNHFKNDLIVITDLCLCQFTDHGHCGIVKDNKVLNDPTLRRMQEIAVSHVKAGADVVAPSGMMDGQVQAIRKALDDSEFENVLIMSYSAKFASNFYGPFRDAAYSSMSFGDRKSYQMDYSNNDEAMREVLLDINEGADIIMVKPALAYLDLVYRIKNKYRMPTAVYNVSGEYSMIKAAAEKGWIDEKKVVLESITAMKRAGADMILTYYAKDIAKWLNENE